MKLFKNNQKGFTLIELLVVIGILAVLLAITLIAINPARQFAQANNTKRRSDVNAILNAVNQYMADNKGVLPSGITTTAQNISDTAANICTALVPTYIAALPADPQINSGLGVGAAISDCAQIGGYDTGYTIVQSADNNRITVTAPTVELSDPVSVTR
ncbi:MAG: type II secretion system protein [Candidatus Levybacteria bacterium]|nr:type II secretion system protein [Candidatus Levybacteria bacterium]MDZ4227908.1 type II secretion system protein [Candidatus Levybacteria bacterium]